MELLISPEKDKKAVRRFEDLEKKIGGSTAMMAEIAVVLAEKNKRNFERVRQAPTTIEIKQKYGMSQEPLVESGRMKAELTTEKGIKMITPTELRFGSSSLAEGEGRGKQITVAKAALIQKGTKTMQKHRVLSATITTRREISEIVMDHLTR